MKSINCLIFTCTACAYLTAMSNAYGKEKRWSVTAGAKTRNIEADFFVAAPQYDVRTGFSENFQRIGGSGTPVTTMESIGEKALEDKNLAEAGRTITYKEGQINITPTKFKFLGASFNSIDYWESNFNLTAKGKGNYDIYTATFTAEDIETTVVNGSGYTETTLSTSGSFGDGFRASDDATEVGPFVELRYIMIKKESFNIAAMAGWSYFKTTLNSGVQSYDGTIQLRETTKTTRSASITTTKTTSFGYFYEGGTIDKGFKEKALNQPDPLQFIKDKVKFQPKDFPVNKNPPMGALPPTTEVITTTSAGKTTSSSQTYTFTAYGGSDVDVDFHEIILGPELEFEYKGFFLGLLLGPTINFIDLDLKTWQKVYREGQSDPVYSNYVTRSDDDVEIGFAIQASAEVMIWEEKNVYLYGSGGYSWVDDQKISNEISSTSVDLTSWTASLGLGVRF